MSEDTQPSVPRPEGLDRHLLVGLGNPGPRYAETRHNVGFLVVDELSRVHGIPLSSKRFDGHFGDGLIEGKRVALLEPQTFMNRSGLSVAKAERYLSLPRGGLIVIHDDVDLPLGRLRLKWSGGNGGHKGLSSIDSTRGGTDYFRVRVGVGRPRVGSVTDYVLSRFAVAERGSLVEVVEGAAEAVRLLLREGLLVAQNQVHGRLFGRPTEPEATADG